MNASTDPATGDVVIDLVRLGYLPFGTFGRILMPSHIDSPRRTFYTAEREWHNNEVGVSCIPEGLYHCTLGWKYKNNGGGYPDYNINNVAGRTDIELHSANWPHQLEGCIAIGLTLGILVTREGRHLLGVGTSQTALQTFMAAMHSAPFTLRIRGIDYRKDVL